MPNAKRSEEIYLLSVGKPIICLSSKFVRGLKTKKSDFLQGSVVCNFKKKAKRKSPDKFDQFKDEVSEKNIISRKDYRNIKQCSDCQLAAPMSSLVLFENVIVEHQFRAVLFRTV